MYAWNQKKNNDFRLTSKFKPDLDMTPLYLVIVGMCSTALNMSALPRNHRPQV